jgi:hypothetical protein
MRRAFRATLLLLAIVVAAPTVRAEEEEFTALFDGKTLEGWSGDEDLWSVEDGMIVGSTESKDLEKNTFLSTKKPYKNFVFKTKFKLRNGNSGIQFRSKQHEDHVVRGYQADIADKRYMGILYEEGGRGILADVKDEEEVAKHIKKDDWNEYVLTVDGPHIKQELNGFTTIEYEEKEEVGAEEGIIALQLHVGPKMKIYFKDVEIKELP